MRAHLISFTIILLSIVSCKEVNPNETAFYWEDDFCQVEIIPRENSDFVRKQSDTIERSAEKHKSGEGYTDIYERKENPFSTKSKIIKVSDLEDLLIKSELTKVKKLETGDGIFDIENKKIRAYKDTNFTIFYDFENQTVNNIWITSDFVKKKESSSFAVKVLNDIGYRFNLILIDWNSSELIDLKEKKQIKDYLNKFSQRT